MKRPGGSTIAIRGAVGFTLVEILTVVTVMGIIGAIATQNIATAMRLYALNTSVRTVEAAIRGARYSAVSKNRTVRVRFDCPAADQFRVVEVVGTPAIDDATDRCSETAYPYPDPNPAAAPNVDGPVVLLPADAEFDAIQNVEIDTAGRVTPLTGCPTCVAGTPPATVTLGNGYETRTITISASGQVQVP